MLITKRFHRQILEAQQREHDKLVAALSDQVDYLRHLLGRPLLTTKPANPSDAPLRMREEQAHMSEIEEEVAWLEREGKLDPEHAREVLAEFGSPAGPELSL